MGTEKEKNKEEEDEEEEYEEEEKEKRDKRFFLVFSRGGGRLCNVYSNFH